MYLMSLSYNNNNNLLNLRRSILDFSLISLYICQFLEGKKKELVPYFIKKRIQDIINHYH